MLNCQRVCPVCPVCPKSCNMPNPTTLHLYLYLKMNSQMDSNGRLFGSAIFRKCSFWLSTWILVQFCSARSDFFFIHPPIVFLFHVVNPILNLPFGASMLYTTRLGQSVGSTMNQQRSWMLRKRQMNLDTTQHWQSWIIFWCWIII